ncbi:MAG: NAD(P)-dependent alcohol dehydrogenase [Candidatus Thorarchaeota archaeon]
MKAIVTTGYGSPDKLQYKDVETPTPAADEVLIRIRAASVNAADFEIQRGGLISRMQGPRSPKYKIPGSDVAGEIVEVGKDITKFKAGDEVVGDLFYSGFGCYAEYVCSSEDVLTLKPPNMTFEQASTYPQAAVIALQCLRIKKQIQPGHKVLFNGAGGGMGTFGVQIAKSYGAEVTGVDSAEKLDILRSIGADHVINYRQTDFTKTGELYDVIVDTVANRSIFAYRRALKSEGMFVMIGGSRGALFQTVFLGPLLSRRGNKWSGINWWSLPYNKDDMDFLEALFDEGKVVPVIDRSYSLSETAEAYRYLEGGHALGKLVITMEE